MWGVGHGRFMEGRRCTCQKNGIAYMTSIRKKVCLLGNNDCNVFIPRTEPCGKRPSTEQLLESRIMRWSAGFCLHTLASNTFILSATLSWIHQGNCCNSLVL